MNNAAKKFDFLTINLSYIIIFIIQQYYFQICSYIAKFLDQQNHSSVH